MFSRTARTIVSRQTRLLSTGCVESGNPCLTYFPIAGRGELAKLIAATGGVKLDVQTLDFDIMNADAEYKQVAADAGYPGCGLPILEHGDLKIVQSQAIQSYLADIAPGEKSSPL